MYTQETKEVNNLLLKALIAESELKTLKSYLNRVGGDFTQVQSLKYSHMFITPTGSSEAV